MNIDLGAVSAVVPCRKAKTPSSWRGLVCISVCRVLGGLLLVPLLASPAHATSDAWTSCMNGVTPDTQTAPSGPVSASIACGWGVAHAGANDLALAMSADASGSGTTTAEEADAEARMRTTLTVLPGSSGLALGAPVTLRFSVVATGSGSATAGGPANSYGYCDGDIRFRILDAPAPGGALIASYAAWVGVDAYYSENLNQTDIIERSWAEYLNAFTYDYKEYSSNSSATLPPGSGFGNDNFIDFDTTVGAVLYLDAQVWEQAGGGPNTLGQSGPASGSVTMLMSPPQPQSQLHLTSVPAPATFTPAPGCGCDGLELVIGPVDPVSVGGATTAFRLHGASPNPFRGTTVVSYELAAPGAVTVAIYDVSGRLVRRLVNRETSPAGPGQVVWDGRDSAGNRAAAGLYLCRMSAGGRVAMQRVVLQR